MAIDQWGCPVTAGPDEVALIEGTAAEYITMSPAIEHRLGPLAEGGPMARALLAQLLSQSHRPALMAHARDLSQDARDRMGGLSTREQAHIEAAWAWSRGHIDRAVTAFDVGLGLHPTDLHALRSRYLLQFSSGRIDDMLVGIRTARPHWHDQLPLASYLDGMESFALEEAGAYPEAEHLGRQGVARDPGDLWAIHAVAHVLEMQHRRDEGVTWIGVDNPTLAAGSGVGFVGHLWWHQALALLALGRHHDALYSFDRRIYPLASQEGLDLTNAISLLARLEMAGTDVGGRWDRLAGGATARLGQHSHPFNDTHFVLALSRAGQPDQAEALVSGMEAWSARPDDHAAAVLNAGGLAVARGLLAFGQGRWADAVHHLAPAADQWWRLGGSHAQRQLYRLVLDHAAGRTLIAGTGTPDRADPTPGTGPGR